MSYTFLAVKKASTFLTDNEFLGLYSIHNHMIVILVTDNMVVVFVRFISAYWIAHPNNNVVDNVAVGAVRLSSC